MKHFILRKFFSVLCISFLCLHTGSNIHAGDQIASAADLAPQNAVSDEGLVPVYADVLAEGTYGIEVSCSSTMFPIEHCDLVVKDGNMEAVLTMGGEGYLFVYPGTAQEAAQSSLEERISFERNDEGKQTYRIPVEALDQEIPLAAFSKKKEQWYDRILLFQAASLPMEARLDLDIVTVQSLGLADGNYAVAVELAGGSGHTVLESPVQMQIQDQKALAKIIWGSTKYDYMIVDGEKIEWNVEGDAAFFWIPVKAFDYPIEVIVDTTAMNLHTEIPYTLTFSSASVS